MLKLMVVEFVYNSPHLDVHQALSKGYKKLIQLKPNDQQLNRIYYGMK